MPKYEGKVSSALTENVTLRKTPGTGMKVQALKPDTIVKGDKLETGSDGKLWLHITDPKEGWALASQLNYIEAPANDSSSAPIGSTPTKTGATTSNAPVTPSEGLWKVRVWGDPIMVKQGFDVDFAGTTNFQAVPLYIENGQGGGVSNFLNIPREDIEKLKALQVSDHFPVEHKMEWLCGFRGKIYMFDNQSDNWHTAPSIRWGTIALGGNLVLVDKVVKMTVKPPDKIKREMDMARLVSFRKTDWGKTWQTHPYLVHRAYCAYKRNKFGDAPKGIVYTPFWSPLDWDFVGVQQPQAWYIPFEWLEPVK
jgi:hypothetical protein